MTKSNISHKEQTYDFEKLRERFDPELVTELEDKKFGSDQEYFDSYLVRHHEKFNEQFEVH